jgi:hypothetical protein
MEQCFLFLAKFRHFSTKKLGKFSFLKCNSTKVSFLGGGWMLISPKFRYPKNKNKNSGAEKVGSSGATSH